MFICRVYLFIINLFVLTLVHTQDHITNNSIFPQSDSVIIISGTSFINTDNPYKNIKGIPATIDWSKIPELGIPTNEIYAIKILKNKVSTSNNIVLTTPNTWRFKSKNWSIDYIGSIPYLEKLSFLPTEYNTNLSTSNYVRFAQNPNGYFLDTTDQKSGLQHILDIQDSNSVSSIYIISKKDNKKIYQTTLLLDEKICSNQIDIITNEIIKTELTNTTNSSITNKKSSSPSHSINSSSKQSVQTSIEKRQQYKTIR